MVDFAAAEIGAPRDILRDPICDLVEEHKNFAELASAKKALHKCKGLVSRKEVNDDANKILQSLQDMVYEMSATDRHVTANVVAAGRCSDMHGVDLQMKSDTISKALANSTDLVESFHSSNRTGTGSCACTHH